MPLDFMDKDGNLISAVEWMYFKADDKYCRIAYDEFQGGEVSTVWLGAMPSHLGIFETMVFFDSGETRQVRYSTQEEALAGHLEMLALVMPPAEGPPVAPGQQPDEEHRNGTH